MAQANAKSLKDSTQINQIHKSMIIYANENKGRFPIPGLINRKATTLAGNGSQEINGLDIECAAGSTDTIELDLKHPRGKQVLERLIAKADVVIENFRPGTLARLGFSWERIQELKTRMSLKEVRETLEMFRDLYDRQADIDDIIRACSLEDLEDEGVDLVHCHQVAREKRGRRALALAHAAAAAHRRGRAHARRAWRCSARSIRRQLHVATVHAQRPAPASPPGAHARQRHRDLAR